MTTIVGIQGDGFAVVATDSRISSMDSTGFTYQVSTLGTGTSKVSQNGKYLLGAAGDVRAINIIHHAFVPPTPAPTVKGKKLDHFVTMKLIPALRDAFEDAGYAAQSKDEQAEHGSTIIAVINNTIYIIEGDYSWTSDTSGIYAIGTGAPYALGAIQALMPKHKPTLQQARVIANKALTITSRFDPYTGSPFQTYSQGNPV